MLQEIVETAKFLKSRILMDEDAEVYRKRAEFYRQWAMEKSFFYCAIDNTKKGADLVDIVESSKLIVFDGKTFELAQTSDGIYYAKIEGGKYYEINSRFPEYLINKARIYESAANSFFRRLFRLPLFLLEQREFSIENWTHNFSKSVMLSALESGYTMKFSVSKAGTNYN